MRQEDWTERQAREQKKKICKVCGEECADARAFVKHLSEPGGTHAIAMQHKGEHYWITRGRELAGKVVYDFGAGHRAQPGALTVNNGWFLGEPDRKPDVTCDLNNPPCKIKAGSADFIFLHNTLEHLENAQVCLKEVARVLKRGGECEVWVPFFYPLHGRPHDFHRYTRERLEGMVKVAGLKVVKWQTFGGRLKVGAMALFSDFPFIGRQYSKMPILNKEDQEKWPLWYRFTARKE